MFKNLVNFFKIHDLIIQDYMPYVYIHIQWCCLSDPTFCGWENLSSQVPVRALPQHHQFHAEKQHFLFWVKLSPILWQSLSTQASYIKQPIARVETNHHVSRLLPEFAFPVLRKVRGTCALLQPCPGVRHLLTTNHDFGLISRKES